MRYKHILVTGGAGFIGSTICLKLKEKFSSSHIIALDNLYRKGSELNVERLRAHGIEFRKGDVRKKKDLEISPVDLIIECSAEPSVMAGVTSSPVYVIDTNLFGAVNCFELARRQHADVVFLSTSRVYPVEFLNELGFTEKKTRYELKKKQVITGASSKGITETFPLIGTRTFYGASKLSAELVLAEYTQTYGVQAVIDRFGVVAGPWQMGKVDQGIVALWVAHHAMRRPLAYIGFGGKGKQVRDILHVDDLVDLLFLQIAHIEKFSGNIYNAGGGNDHSISLLEMTALCQEITGVTVPIARVSDTRPGDVRIYITDNTKVLAASGWRPKKTTHHIIEDTFRWIKNYQDLLAHILE